jgi:type I restriction enzyme S subunit
LKEATLRDLCVINPRKPTGLDPNSQCSFVPMDHVDDHFGIISEMSMRRVAEVENGYTYFENGDVLFAKITPCMENGKCAIAKNLTNGIGFGSTEFHVVRAKESVTPEWVYYYLRQETIRKEAQRSMTGSAGQRRVPSRFLKDTLIPVPPLPEQKRIAVILAKADRLRRLRRYARDLSDTYLQSVFLEMFGDPVANPMGWEQTTIGEIVASSQYGTSKKSNSEQKGYPVLGMGNITYSGKIDLTSLSYVELSEEEFETLRLLPGDIIFNRTNSTELVGKTAHWNEELDAVLASYLVKLRLKPAVLPDYFAALLNSGYYKILFQYRCRKAVGQSNISPTLLKEFPMLIPPLPLQQKFARVVHEFERLRAQQREAKRQAEHLFQTLLHWAFLK